MLRPATVADIGFLRAFYGELRATELAGVAWPEAFKRDFLDQQFTLQHRSYTTRFPGGDFLLIEQAGCAIGRLYLDRHGADWHLIDIGLLAAAQGHGIGTALIGRVQALAGEQGAGLGLHVRLDNQRARALYESLGFEAGATEGHHLAMRWIVPSAVS
ncbi:MAG TPA: N-acetyltransferase [Oleiagrimonas sp.]|nr:N-acetyltransferase [Oleiagrimonas sp.]